MGNYKPGGKRFGGGGGGGGRGGFKGRSSGRPSWGGSDDRRRGPVTMHQVICDQCGKSCEVPFKPTAGKPVYCNVCFETQREGGDNRRGGGFVQKDFGGYKAPVRTEVESGVAKADNSEIKKQLELLNGKMDRLISIIESIASPKAIIKSTPVIKAKKSKKVFSKK